MRKIKFNKYAKRIEATLDLHGYDRYEGAVALEAFLSASINAEYGRVAIVTGKGLHSPDGRSVLKEMSIDILKRIGLKFREGKVDEGGEGVLVVDF